MGLDHFLGSLAQTREGPTSELLLGLGRLLLLLVLLVHRVDARGEDHDERVEAVDVVGVDFDQLTHDEEELRATSRNGSELLARHVDRLGRHTACHVRINMCMRIRKR